MEHRSIKRRIASTITATLLGAALVAAMPSGAGAAPSLGSLAHAAALSQAPTAPLAPNLHLFPAMVAAGSVLGHPYRWGGAAPGGFDCSGLVRWSFAHAGRDLPHGSGAQRSITVPVAAHEARAGDLVFFGSPTHHVGIYMGDGLMVHSPSSGKVVTIASVHDMGSAPSFGRVK